MRLPNFFTSFFQKFKPVIQAEKPLRRSQRRLPTKVDQNQFTEFFVSQIARLPIRAKQMLMLDLYVDKNMFLERYIDFLVNPIVGRQGFMVDVDENSKKTQQVFRRFTKLNRLDIPIKQRELLRDYLLTGEICLLAVPNSRRDTFQLIQIPAPVIRQTIVDPGNYMEIIAIEQEVGNNDTILHRVITDEDLLSPQAIELRSQMKFECFLFQNKKRSYPTASPYGVDLLRKYELRGEPYLINSADLLQALVSYLWKTLDKMDSWNLFNYKFTVDTSSLDREGIQGELDEWADAIGTPSPNSAIYLPKDIVTMEPVSFPMQSTDLGQFYRMVRNATAWHGGTRETSMGEGEVRYASNAEPGVEEPSVETKDILQRDQEDFYREMYDYVGKDALSRGIIPPKEIKEKIPPEFSYTIVSNEISKISQEGPTTSFATFVDTSIKIKADGMGTPESVHKAVAQKGKELLAIEIIEPEQAEEGEMLSPQIPESEEEKNQPPETPGIQEKTELIEKTE